ncbi:MAG: dihydrolipoamide acetyltransferase family protein [Actinomycetota bacterium]
MPAVKMPQLGETVIEGTILRWLKAEGDVVKMDEPLFEISTDKVDTEVPSSAAGVLTKILVPEGTTVGVGTEVAIIQGEGEAAAPAPAAVVAPAPVAPAPVAPAPVAPAPVAPAPVPPAPVAPAAAPVATGPRSAIHSPLVRRLAAEHGVDLANVSGTGTGGRITKQDVLAFVASGAHRAAPAAEAPAPTPVVPAPAPIAPAPAAVPAPVAPKPAAPAAPVAPTAPPVPGGAEERIAVSHIRRAIGDHMLASLRNTARAWTMVEVNVDHLVRLRDRVKDDFQAKYGVKLTYLPFVVRATSEALLEFPMVNARLDGDEIVLRRYVNMGIAVSYEAGLIVPVIKGADAMNSVGLARAIADLAARARSRQLKPDEVQGSTFTITNPGPYGSVASVPIINTPDSGILSLDAIVKRPVVVDDGIAVRSMVNISMSWDHRVIDGELATRFLGRVKRNLEAWDYAEDLGL